MTHDEIRNKAREWRRRREDIHGRHGGNVAELTFSEIDELLADFAESLEPAAPSARDLAERITHSLGIHEMLKEDVQRGDVEEVVEEELKR